MPWPHNLSWPSFRQRFKVLRSVVSKLDTQCSIMIKSHTPLPRKVNLIVFLKIFQFALDRFKFINGKDVMSDEL